MAEEDKNQLEEIGRQVIELGELVKYQSGAIVSRTLVDKDAVTLTLFAFDKDQTLSEHTSPHSAILQVLEGSTRVTIDGTGYDLEQGESIIMPANVPHGVEATEKFKMFLTMVK
ncbi:MAG: cupin domain-containing protein [Candidatus Bipolaricaulota bacterium]